MLVKISQSNLSDVDKVGVAAIRGWDAVDLDNFAYLLQTNGRGKYGLPKFILSVYVEHPETFEDTLKAYADYARIYSTIRAWSLDEAIEVANRRLPRLLKRVKQTLAEGEQTQREYDDVKDFMRSGCVR